jgi:hypothetical protein
LNRIGLRPNFLLKSGPQARQNKYEWISAPPVEALATTGAWLNQIKDGFQRAFRLALEQKDIKPRMSLSFTCMFITAEEQEKLYKQITELVKPYETRRGIEGELEVQGSLIVYPQLASVPTSSQVKLLSTEDTQVVGTVSYDRKDLEKLLAEDKRLHVNIIGVCHIDDDVDADLAERAIEHFHIVGKLVASDPVREVLITKS